MEGLTTVREKLARPQRSIVASRTDQSALELETAKEILAEVFSIRISEVEEMILGRLEEVTTMPDRPKGDGLWPREFVLDG